MQKNTLKYSALVFIAGASYGVMGTVIKTAFQAGFTWPQTVAAQATSGVLLFAVAFFITMLFGVRPRKLPAKQVLALLGLGMTTCTTCILYNFALSRLPVAVAITLLFQFTWVSFIIQIAACHRRPRKSEIAAVVVILGGTLLASGLFSEDIGRLDVLGVAAGLLSAVSTALFMYLSSRIGVGLPPVQRGLIVCIGASILGLAACPTYFTSGVLLEGMFGFGLVLGLFALFIPVMLFGIGTPHLTPGLAAIMSSAELPCGVLIAVLVLGEPVDLFQTVGVIIILTGVVVSQLPNLKPVALATPDAPAAKNASADNAQVESQK